MAEPPDGDGATRSESGVASTPGRSSGRPEDGRRSAPGVARTQQPTVQDKLANADRTGERFGRYRVLARLGEGGMGVVYAALDPALDRRVALKVLPALAEDRRAHFEARLRREAQALARLEHPNVVRVYDVGVAEHSVFVAMQLVDGTNLAEYVRATRPKMRDLLGLLAAAGRGLAAAHEAGIVHRDVKASNVFVDKRGTVFVGDFGLARGIDEADLPIRPTPPTGNDLLHAQMTRAGAVLGTPAYMSPEQHRGESATARSDQFSYCVSVWELLFDAHPFTGGAWNPAALVAMSEDAVHEPARRGVPARVVRALRRGLRHAPEARWPSVDELVDEIEPRSRATWLWVGAAGVAMVGVAAATAVVAGGSSSDTRACDAAIAKLEPIWPGNVVRVRDALAAFALDGEGKLVGALDEYAQAWRTARQATCEAEDRTPVMRELQARCLDDMLRVFGDFVEALPGVKRSALAAAHDTVRKLPSLGDCSVGSLAAMPPVPAHALVGVSDTRLLLGQARTKLFTGDVAGSRALIEQAKAKAGELAYAPLVAEAAFGEAELMFQTDDPRASEVASQAAEVATTARADRIAAQAYALALVDAANRPDAARVEVLTPVARAAAQRVGEPVILAQSAHAAAAGARATGRLDDALASCKQSQEQVDKLAPGGERDNAEDDAAGCFTAVYVARGDTPNAAVWAERWLAIAARRFGTDTLGSLRPVRELATIRFSEGKHDAALALARRALAIAEHALGRDSEELLDDLSTLSQMLAAAGRAEEAMQAARRALPIIGKVEANGTLRKRFLAKMTLGDMFRLLGRLNDMARAYMSALELGEKLPRDDDHVATASFNIGLMFIEGGELEDGKKLVDRAAGTWARTGNPRSHVANGIRAEILERAGKCDDAIPLFDAAIKGMEQQPSERANLIRARMRLAACLSERDTARGEQLARGVVEDAAELGATGAELVAEAKAWLAFHRSTVAGRSGATQWASRVRDSSSEYGAISWSAQQALGAPDTYPDHRDSRTAWAPRDEDGETEWIEVGFARPAPARGIVIYETYNAGAVTLVEIITASGRREVQRVRPAVVPGARINTVEFACTSEPVLAVRLTLSSRAVPGWNEIDAIGVIDCP